MTNDEREKFQSRRVLRSGDTNDLILSTIKTVDHQVLERDYFTEKTKAQFPLCVVPKTILKKKETSVIPYGITEILHILGMRTGQD